MNFDPDRSHVERASKSVTASSSISSHYLYDNGVLANHEQVTLDRLPRYRCSAKSVLKSRSLMCRNRPENLLLLFTLIAVVLGSCIGLSLNTVFYGRKLTNRELAYLQFPGQLFLRMLKMLIIPMVIASNISSIASLNTKAAGWLAGLSISYYVITSMISVLLGTILTLVIKPGLHRSGDAKGSSGSFDNSKAEGLKEKGSLKLLDSLLDLIRNLVPENFIRATFERDTLEWKVNKMASNISQSANQSSAEEYFVKGHAPGTNILGLIVFSIFFGIAVRNLGDEASVLAELFHALRRTMVYLVSIVMWISPLGIMSLIAENIAKEPALLESLNMLSLYAACVMAGLFIHGVFVLSSLLYLFTRRNPAMFASNMLQALMCAAGTASSTATLPCTIRCLESGNNIDPRVTRFMLPLGTTINMDGTVMYEAVAVIYIAQRLGFDLSLSDILMIDLSATLAGTAAASMPSAGIITMAMVLMSVGLPASACKLIIPVDWFLDRFRTMVNVLGDAVGAAIVSKLCEGKLIADGPCDPKQLPDVQGTVVHNPGGLASVDLRDLNAHRTAKRWSDVERNTPSPLSWHRMNGNIATLPRSATLSADTTAFRSSPNVDESRKGSAACVYVVDEDTVVLKF